MSSSTAGQGGSAQANNEGGIEGAHELGGRDPLLVVNIHKPREREGVEVGWGRDRERGGGERRTPNSVYVVNHEVTSSDEDLEVDEVKILAFVLSCFLV